MNKLIFLSLSLFYCLTVKAQQTAISTHFYFDIGISENNKVEQNTLTYSAKSNLFYFKIGKKHINELDSNDDKAIAVKVKKSNAQDNLNIENKSHLMEGDERLETFIIDRANTEDRNKDLIETAINKYFALIISMNDYQFNSSELSDLNYPRKDAFGLIKTLTANYTFDKKNIIHLKDPTRSKILETLDNLVNNIEEDQNLLIFYAGHGKWNENLKTGYWLPVDARTNSKANWISNSTLTDYLAGIKSKHTLLISDACFSGSIFKTRSISENLNTLGFSKIYSLPSRKAMTSGSLKTVPDKSIFMKYLLKRLDQFDGEYLTTKNLYYSIHTAVINNSNNVPQFGVIQNSGDEGGDFIFIKK